MRLLNIVVAAVLLAGCQSESDITQAEQQEQLMKEAGAQTGMPNIRNFAERKMVKRILEMRDDARLSTYTYFYSPFRGLRKLCDSLGYPLPYATQYTNPQKVLNHALVVSQADPNGLYAPSSSRASWVLCKVPGQQEAAVVYAEPDLMTFPYAVPEDSDPRAANPAAR